MKDINNLFLVNLYIVLIALAIILTGCDQDDINTKHPDSKDKAGRDIKFTDTQEKKIKSAMNYATNSFNDPLFSKILWEQSNSRTFDWSGRILEEVDSRHHKNPVDYFLSQFKQSGLTKFEQYQGHQYDDDDVTGSTVTCSTKIRLGVKKINDRKPVSISGTLIHERIHSFCFQHQSNENDDYCDFAYQAGHLAAIIAMYRENGDKPINKPGYVICKSLRERLVKHNILKK